MGGVLTEGGGGRALSGNLEVTQREGGRSTTSFTTVCFGEKGGKGVCATWGIYSVDKFAEKGGGDAKCSVLRPSGERRS